MKGSRLSPSVFAALLALALPAHSQQAELKHETYDKPYQFGADWFSVNAPVWREHLAPLLGKPGLHYLEIGPYEGRSFFWVVEKVLTHPTSRATAIDVFDAGTSTHYEETYEQVFRSNVELSGAADRITIIKARSQDALRKLPDDSFDLIYVDGSHAPHDVLSDVVLSWPLLEEGGLMILDDYKFRPRWPSYLRPFFAINTFISAYAHEVEVLHRGFQVILRKHPNRCLRLHYEGCSYLGPYFYDWRDEGALVDADSLKEVTISESEKRLIEKILESHKIGAVEPSIGEAMRRNKLFIEMNERLGLGF